MIALHLLLVLAASITNRSTAVQSESFRPPSIPLITTDPFMQTHMMGDASTSDDGRFWDGRRMEMFGLVRIDGSAYRYLGTCDPALAPSTGPSVSHSFSDISPGSCDIVNFPDSNENLCNRWCYGTENCRAYVMSGSTCYLKSCTTPVVVSLFHTAHVITGSRNSSCPPPLKQNSVTVGATTTSFFLELPGTIAIKVSFVSTLFTDDFVRLSRPVAYIRTTSNSLDGKKHSLSL